MIKKILYVYALFILNYSYANSVSGIIKDNLLNDPISFAKVILFDQSFIKIDSTFSDSEGKWEIQFDPTSIHEIHPVPLTFRVLQNYPNPFNPSTKINFEIIIPGNVKLIISDVLGQTVEEKSQFMYPGSYSINWNGAGSAGVYFYTIVHNNKSITNKMVQLDGNLSGGFSAIRNTPYIESPRLGKSLSGQYKIVFSKFAYVNDTLNVELLDDKYIETEMETIHSKAILVDLHNDVLEKMIDNPNYKLMDLHSYNHTDIPRLKLGGVDAEFFVVWVDPGTYAGRYFETATEMVNIFKSEAFDNFNNFQQGYNASSVITIVNDKKISGILAVEGGHAIENSMSNLKYLYDQGMRYLTITWNNSTDWAVSAQDSRSNSVGLSEFGKKVIRTMDSLGVIIDVSHTGIKTIEDILETTSNPIIASHSGVRSIMNHYRNLYDDQIIAIAKSGGVIGVVFYPPFLGTNSSAVNINTVIDHIDYIVDLVGVDYVALGSDFDGIGTNTVNGLEDVSKFPFLTYKLLEKGYTRNEVEKILGGNFMRVFQKVCKK
ncbi:MAG: membrane dipeptidase [Bacteroidetes bacterium]|nr:membrane dipeptidase [Bacteroidota bacterium]